MCFVNLLPVRPVRRSTLTCAHERLSARSAPFQIGPTGPFGVGGEVEIAYHSQAHLCQPQAGPTLAGHSSATKRAG